MFDHLREWANAKVIGMQIGFGLLGSMLPFAFIVFVVQWL